MDDITIRSDLRAGDIGSLIHLHGVLYDREYGWDWTFEAFVGRTFARLSERWDPVRERIWIAEHRDTVVGCIGILAVDSNVAQLRWFLVDPSVRGRGLGRRLVDDALIFCRSAGYARVFLWTMSSLTAAAHLYRSRGFELTHQETVERWGAVLTEERYDLDLSAPAPAQSPVTG